MTWEAYIATLREIPEATRRAELEATKAALQFNRDYCDDRRQRALTRRRLENKITAITESLS